MEGFEDRLAKIKANNPDIDEQVYRDRIKYEIDIILKMGFPGYFLIVADFIQYAKENGVPVGPGRGSAAGSMVAYAMRITDLDPIETEEWLDSLDSVIDREGVERPLRGGGHHLLAKAARCT